MIEMESTRILQGGAEAYWFSRTREQSYRIKYDDGQIEYIEYVFSE